jgi:hypothetical protein
MSTRATYKFYGKKPYLTLYIHHDGYPKGAAQYVQNWMGNDMENSPYLTVEKFIRANDKAEITQSHESHSDTEYRYDFIQDDEGWKVLVEERKWCGENDFEGIWGGTLDEFVTEHLGGTWLKTEEVANVSG